MPPLVILFYFLKKAMHVETGNSARTAWHWRCPRQPPLRIGIYTHPPPFFLLPRSNYFNNLGTVFAQVYICGGFNGNECLFTAEVYNTESNQWTVIAPMRSRRSGIGVIAYGEHVYAVSLSWTTTKTITLDVLLPNRFTLPLVSIWAAFYPWRIVAAGGLKSLVLP